MSNEDDFSDSDIESVPDVQTSVLLGIPDGSVNSSSDLFDPEVSRIGGTPAFLSLPEPSPTSAQCKECSNPMELLVQMWCPFENSPMDRVLYVWGCSRSPCQRKSGSVRAWRALRYNQKYAKKLEKKLEREKEKERQKRLEQEKREAANAAKLVNPFAATSNVNTMSFGLGAQIFGGASSSPFGPGAEVPPINQTDGDGVEEDEGEDDSESEASSGRTPSPEPTVDSVTDALQETSLHSSFWSATPSFSPIYLSTEPEYIAPPPATKPKISVPDAVEGGKDGGKDGQWGLEAYEHSKGVDEVFERFSRRVSEEGEQCIRYDLGGAPLPFQNDAVFKQLFPAPPSPSRPTTKPGFAVLPPPPKRSYDPSSVPPCPSCNSARTFECQLMPNLINVLRREDAKKRKKLSEEDRKKELERLLGKKETSGMEWGTCLVFSCSKDCCKDDDKGDAKSCWKEEVVLVHWEE